MSRKQNVNSRSTYGIQNNRQHISSKENAKFDTYQLDPKIIQLKKKYQIETQKAQSAYPQNLYGTRAPPSNLRQQQVLRKLQNIKSELKLIPDWQAYARSILFNEISENTEKFSVVNQKQSKKSSQSYQIPRFGGNYFNNYNESQQSIDRSSVMNSSTVSFKVNHAKSIQKYQKKVDTVNTPIRNERNDSNLGEREKYYLKSDNGRRSQQKVDQKINEISRKIKQSEQKKRNLGVEFIPFDKKKIQTKYDTPTQMYEQHSKNAQALLLKNSTVIQNVRSRPPRPAEVSKFNDKSINQDFKEDIQSKSPRFAITPGRIQKLADKTIITPAETLQKKDRYDSHQKGRNYSVNGKQRAKNYNQKIIDEQKDKNSNTSRILLQRVEQSLKQRKKKVENLQNKKKSRQVTQKLVQAFCEQVELDQKFRNSKLWLKAYKSDKKFLKLKNLMEMQGIEMTEEKIMEDFAVQQKEDNPFFSVTSQTCDIDEVVRSYMESEKYWKKNLYKKFSKEALEGEDFNNLSIDLDKKGYIVLQDLVRFLNMETGKFFRNRDLFSIFRRLSKNSEKLNFSVFINAFYY